MIGEQRMLECGTSEGWATNRYGLKVD